MPARLRFQPGAAGGDISTSSVLARCGCCHSCASLHSAGRGSRKVGDLSSARALVMRSSPADSTSPGETPFIVRTVNPSGLTASLIASWLLGCRCTTSPAQRYPAASSHHREPLHIEQAHGGVVIDGSTVADRVPVRPGRVSIDRSE